MNKEYVINAHENNNRLVLSNLNFEKEDTVGGNPYNTTAMVEVISNGFSGISELIFDINEFLTFIKDLDYAYKKLDGIIIFNDISYGSKIQIEFDKLEHITISGVLFSEATIQQLKFEFITDQTVIKDFIKELKEDWVNQ